MYTGYTYGTCTCLLLTTLLLCECRVEPNAIGCTVLNEDLVACVEAETYVTSTIKMFDVIYDAELLGQK